ncbi:MAG: hypothetical protein WAU78_14875 [Roseiarcus sp.]
MDVVLVAIFLLSVALVLLAQEDPFVRNALFGRAHYPEWLHAHALRKLFYDIGIGSLISLIFYALVVRLPERQKRNRLKKSFANYYREFREDCIQVMLMVADGTFEWGFHKTLVDQDKFRAYFREKLSPSEDRWDAFLNKIDDNQLQSLLTYMEILRDEISFVLASIDIADSEPFEFLKRLSNAITLRKNTTLGYDSTESFGNFLWDVFAGYSVATGPRERDIIAEMIKAI